MKPELKIIELFTGIGIWKSTLNEQFPNKIIKTVLHSEWNFNSLKVYNLIHYKKEFKKFSETFKISEKTIIEDILNFTFSLNGKNILTEHALKLRNLKKQKEILCHLVFSEKFTNNIFDINSVNFSCFNERSDMLFYSPPCQDISIQNSNGEGLVGSKSSLIFKVITFLEKIERTNRPFVLVMENVPQIISEKNNGLFQIFIEELENLGYKSSWKIINHNFVGGKTIRKRLFLISTMKKYFLKKFDWKDEEYQYLKIKNKENFKELKINKKFFIFQYDKFLTKLLIENKLDFKTSFYGMRKAITPENWPGFSSFEFTNRIYDSNYFLPTITASGAQSQIKILDHERKRIRFLTAYEMWRISDFSEKNYDKISEHFNEKEIIFFIGNSIPQKMIIYIFDIIRKNLKIN